MGDVVDVHTSDSDGPIEIKKEDGAHASTFAGTSAAAPDREVKQETNDSVIPLNDKPVSSVPDNGRADGLPVPVGEPTNCRRRARSMTPF